MTETTSTPKTPPRKTRPKDLDTPSAPIASPPFRRLRGYAFDPSLSIQLETMGINTITFKVPWEEHLDKGPVGEYLEVVDYDPASGCFYEPVDLNNPRLMAQDGLAPSQGNPQFHQQMVYAVAMTTIQNFEAALGRKAMWRGHMTYRKGQVTEEFVQRLRVYPHALREANAYYSPDKEALLFGYFPATTNQPETHMAGGMVFACLSHDVVAHETTHALLDGMHRRFIEPTNPDLLAFHEAFADIVALFQHFSFPEVLRSQIAKTRGDLSSENLLAQLAKEFGVAIGGYGALRDALGKVDPQTGKWERLTPNPQDYLTVMEPHARGSILVAAVFDAFTSIYKLRIADLLRIASGGTGILPNGALHPDLVNRLADEASKAAHHILLMCIRGLDYCPPIDLTYGDYLRAVITADKDIVPDDDLGYRVAFIEAFRRRGIYPHDVRNLSVESLTWQALPENQDDDFDLLARKMRHVPDRTRLFKSREATNDQMAQMRTKMHELIEHNLNDISAFENVTGLKLTPMEIGSPQYKELKAMGFEFSTLPDGHTTMPKFEVHSLRPAQRVGPDGDLLNQLMVSITQKRTLPLSPNVPGDTSNFAFRGGCTLILDLDDLHLHYCIPKSITDDDRLNRQRAYLHGAMRDSLRATYFAPSDSGKLKEPFALIHREF